MTSSNSKGGRQVRLGYVSGVHGVKGWIKVHSFTDPRENVVRFPTWTLAHDGRRRRVSLEDGRAQGRHVLAKLEGVDDRDAAAELVGAEISVDRASLPACGPREYYWTDLEGLRVEGADGRVLGRVDRLISTGAHDVLVLHGEGEREGEGEGERLIPFVLDEVVSEVDLEAGRLVVRWDESFWTD